MDNIKKIIEIFKKNKQIMIISLSILVVIIVMLFNYIEYNTSDKDINLSNIKSKLNQTDKSHKTYPNNSLSDNSQKGNNITIYLCGSVKNPGLYTVNSTEVLGKIITQNGGLKSNADLNRINLARNVKNGEKVYIPFLGEKENEIIKFNSDITLNKTNQDTISDTTSQGAYNTQDNSKKVNINTADTNGLESVPGIGPAKAKAIIEYRSKHGGFKTIQELDNVNRIGPKTIDSLKDYICIQ